MPRIAAALLGLALLLQLCLPAVADPFATLGLSRGATEEAIKKTYRVLALELHPDKNPDPAAKRRWLEVQAAYEELTNKGSGSAATDLFTRRYREQQQATWRDFWQAPRPPPHIPSATQTLDATAFNRLVLSAAGRPGGKPWVIQIFAEDSPYCRALSPQWEAAAREVGGLASFGRVDFRAQPMLVRFLAANLRGLFHTAQPWRDLPVVFGLPQGCFRMACALPFSTHFTSERLQQFVAARLLRLPALPPLSPRLLGAWCAAMPSGRVGVLALLRPGQQQPLPLLGAVAEARGRLQAAAAVWRPADSATWTEQTGAAAPPALVICKGPIGQRPRHLVTVQAGLLVDGSSWAEQVQRNALQAGTAGKGPEAGLLAVTLASLLLHSIHAASRMELLWQRLAKGFGVMLRLMGWEQALVAAAVVVALLALKKMLDVLTGEDEDEKGGSPLMRSPKHVSSGISSPAGRVREMKGIDWEPSPGRFLVLLPLPVGSCVGQRRAAAEQQLQLESLAAVFQKERRLAFRVTHVSSDTWLFPAEVAGAAGGSGAAGGVGPVTGGTAQQQQKQEQATAYVLHPRRGRFQALPLGDTQAAVLRLEALLDGGGTWHHVPSG